VINNIGQITAASQNQPKDNPLQLLAAAQAAVNAGRIDQATSLLTDQLLNDVRELARNDSSRTDIMLMLAALLYKIGQYSKAEQQYKEILNHESNAIAYNELACLCYITGRMTQAVQYQKRAVETEPNAPEYLANLAKFLIATGQRYEGIDLLRKAIEKMPENPQIHSNLLHHLHQLPDMDPQMLFDEHKNWARIHASPTQAKKAHNNTCEPDKRLRIGYISPDFHEHSVTYFFEPLLDGHNRQNVEVYGYGNVEFCDSVTECLKTKFDHYRNIYSLSDTEAAKLIEDDKIDILVDLAGHTAGNRLLVMALKPAPIQVTYLGYDGTTGMEQIDYRLTDALAEPPELQKFYVEELVFLPHGHLCYSPPDFAPPLTPLPADEKGYITFGSFNNNRKINSFIIGLWSEILKANQNSHLLLKFAGGDEQEIKNHYIVQFEQLGVEPERIEIYGRKPRLEHLQMYGRVDIALDTYPYNGTTTTCEALWMGVPTVSLRGNSYVSRAGLSILNRVGLDFFVAQTPQGYVAKSTALANKRQALAKIRTAMHARLARTGFCHEKAFAYDVEEAYRKMWHKWCQSHSRGGCCNVT